MADYRPRARSWERECFLCGHRYILTNFMKRKAFNGRAGLTDTHLIACWLKQHPEERPKGGMVSLDSQFAKSIGFTSDKFRGWCWIKHREFWISCIESLTEGKGNLRTMIEAVLAKGYTIKVPTPLARMKTILKRLGFMETWDHDKALGESIEVWMRKP